MFEFSEEKYNEELRALFVRFPSVQTTQFKNAYKPGLENILKFDEILGFPSRKIKTVHVAGTNGKGSVSNMIAASLCGAGYKTGLYTSPHILDFRERMRIGKSLISKEYVYDFILQWKDVFDKLQLSFFEITTGMAFKWFSDMAVDVAVIEVGLGGRLDSTNIISPELSVITSIGLDHCEYLGNTLAAIAGEKAGIIKENVPVVIGQTLDETAPVFLEKARISNSEIIFADKVKPLLWNKLDSILKKMDLQGEYQKFNLRTALVSLGILKKEFTKLDNLVNIETSLMNTAKIMDFHGRWEKLSDNPVVICDIGHNAAALVNNFAQLKRMLTDKDYSSLIIIYAVMADKNLDAILPLMPLEATYIFTTPSTPRALPAPKICERFESFLRTKGLFANKLYVQENVADAVKLALKLASEINGKPLIYIGGSTFTVAEAVPCFSVKV